MRQGLEYADANHSIWVVVDCDWGGPCRYIPYCRCGWRGTVVGDVVHQDGLGQLGTKYSAFAEALDHMGMTVSQWIDLSENYITRWMDNIKMYVDSSNQLRTNIKNMRELI
jgi:hypothetical protein